MLNKIINLTLEKRLLVGLFLLFLAGAGAWSYYTLPVDAFPDVSPVMVPVFAEAHGMAPEEVERLITFPIETAMNGLPGVTSVRSTSAFGMAVIYVYFTDKTDIYFARQLVSERLNSAIADLPEMHELPGLGPISTGLGQIFMYYLSADSTVETEGVPVDIYLRTVNDWVVKYQLGTVPGVTDIFSMGGNVQQFQVKVDPFKLMSYDLTLNEIAVAIRQNNRNVGGQFIERGSEEYLVRGLGLIEDAGQLGSIKVKEVEGSVVSLRDVAIVEIGPEIRRGVVLKGGVEVVTGIVMKLYGENTNEVIERLYAKVDDLRLTLPKGVTLTPFYEQAHLISEATGTVEKALLEGAVLIVLVLFLFLGNVRSAFVVALSLPMSMLVAFLLMKATGLSANLMSLGGLAIAIGMMVDGAVVMVENIWRHLAENQGKKPVIQVIRQAALEIAGWDAFVMLVIIVVFLPLFTLQGVEGKIFRPMALAITFGMFGSLLFTYTLIPLLASIFFTGHISERESPLVRAIKMGFKPSFLWVLRHHKAAIGSALVLFLLTLLLVPKLGTEFIPTLEEGSIQVGVAGVPSTSLREMTRILQFQSEKIVKYPEVTDVVTRIGRPEAGSHPHPTNTAEIHIELKPFDEWAKGRTKQDLVNDIRRDLENYPGVQISISQPIQNMFDELISGVKAELAIKLYGENMDELRKKGEEIKDVLTAIPGITDLAMEQSFGQPAVQIDVDALAAARYGLAVDDVLQAVELGVGGEEVGQVFQTTRRFGILLRFDERFRHDTEAIGNIMIRSPEGALIPISDVAEINEVIGPIQINREKNQRRIVIQANVEGRDLGGVVGEIQGKIKENIKLSPGYFIEYGGQFENQRRAMTRLAIIVPVTLIVIFLLLYTAFNSLRHATLICLNVPFALIGGILGLYLSGQYLSVPASIGFIALFGVAVLNGVVLVSFLNRLRQTGLSLERVVVEGVLMRVRPVSMTALVTMLGLVPLLFSTGIGAEVQRPLATVVVGGLFTSTTLTLYLLPLLYRMFEEKWGLERKLKEES